MTAEERGTLLKDCTTNDINVAIDAATDAGKDITTLGRSVTYLRWASVQQIATLTARLPHRKHAASKVFVTRRGARVQTVKVVFNADTLEFIVKFLTGKNRGRYTGNRLAFSQIKQPDTLKSTYQRSS